MGENKKIILSALIGISATALGNSVISLEELKKHGAEKNCWMAIDGAVYDVSSYIALHHEECKKSKFADYCGQDVSLLWKQKEASHAPHKKKSLRNLLKSKVGVLSEK